MHLKYCLIHMAARKFSLQLRKIVTVGNKTVFHFQFQHESKRGTVFFSTSPNFRSSSNLRFYVPELLFGARTIGNYNGHCSRYKIIWRDPDMACVHDCQITSQYCIMNCSGDVTCISQCNRTEAQCISGKTRVVRTWLCRIIYSFRVSVSIK